MKIVRETRFKCDFCGTTAIYAIEGRRGSEAAVCVCKSCAISLSKQLGAREKRYGK